MDRRWRDRLIASGSHLEVSRGTHPVEGTSRTAAEREPRARLTSKTLAVAGLGAAFGALALALFAWPIVPHDTDLWYHLNFGRRILATGRIPDGAWYSDVETTSDFTDYYWLSQVLFHTLERSFGLGGLIALRAITTLATAALIATLLARSELARRSPTWAGAVGATAVLVIVERVATVRPHMFSYLGLAAALVLIERGGRALYGLLPVALLWANLHGIEYPVLALVLGAVFVEALWLRGREGSARAAVLVSVALGAVLLTPFGARLLPVPWHPLGLAAHEVFELRPLTWTGLTTFGVRALVPSSEAARALLLLCALLSALDTLLRRRARLRHMIWLAGGIALMLRAERFASEFSLLCLPAIANARILPTLRLGLRSRPARSALCLMLGAIAFMRLAQLTRGPWPYPSADAFLPTGTSAFLRAHERRGRVLHHPNYGGYLQWALPGEFRLGADMQTPFLFPARRVLELSTAFADSSSMQASLQRDPPDFVFVPWNRYLAVEPALLPDYAPLALDDSAVLYAHKQRRAALVARFQLTSLTPAKLQRLLHHALPQAERPAARAELERLLSVNDRVAITRAALAVLEEQGGALASALTHARTATELAPGNLELVRVAGEVALSARAWSTALESFQQALPLLSENNSPRETRSALVFGTARALAELGRSAEIYDDISPAFSDLTDSSVTAADLQLLAAAATDAGQPETSRTLSALAAQRRGEPEAAGAR